LDDVKGVGVELSSKVIAGDDVAVSPRWISAPQKGRNLVSLDGSARPVLHDLLGAPAQAGCRAERSQGGDTFGDAIGADPSVRVVILTFTLKLKTSTRLNTRKSTLEQTKQPVPSADGIALSLYNTSLQKPSHLVCAFTPLYDRLGLMSFVSATN